MKIALFTDTFDQINGVANTYRRLADFASFRGTNLDIYTYGEKDSAEPRGTVRILRFKHALPFRYYSDLLFDLAVVRPKILGAVRSGGYDLIHTATPGSMGINALAASLAFRIRLCGAYHTDLPKYAASRAERFFSVLPGGLPRAIGSATESLAWKCMAAYYNRCLKVLAPSRHTLAELRSRLKAETGLFSRGVDCETFRPVRRKTPKSVPVCLYVGRVSVEKNLGLLEQLFRGRENARLVVVGDGPCRKALQSALPQAEFTGAVHDRNVLRSLYASADIFVFPSETETFGQVLMEAAATGLPRIVTGKGASRELVRHGVDGFVAENMEEFSGYMEKLISEAHLRENMGLAAREFALTKRWDEVFSVLLDEWEAQINK